MDTASLVSAWNALLLPLCCVFTEPTAEVWRQIALGWVLPVVFCLYRKPPDCDRARRPDRPTRLRPMGRGRSDPGSQTAVGLREHPRLVPQDRQSSGPAGDAGWQPCVGCCGSIEFHPSRGFQPEFNKFWKPLPMPFSRQRKWLNRTQ